MKQVKTAMTTVALGLTLSLGMTGCGVPGASGLDDGYDLGGGSGGGKDKLVVNQNGSGFTLEWNKNSSGYSEVGLDSGTVGNAERAETKVVSDNYTGKHTLTCGIGSYGSSYVSVNCYGTGPDFMGGTHDITADFKVEEGKTYIFYQTYGAFSSERHSDDTGYRMRYDNGSLNISKR